VKPLVNACHNKSCHQSRLPGENQCPREWSPVKNSCATDGCKLFGFYFLADKNSLEPRRKQDTLRKERNTWYYKTKHIFKLNLVCNKYPSEIETCRSKHLFGFIKLNTNLFCATILKHDL